jgi:chromosome partitioning protein
LIRARKSFSGEGVSGKANWRVRYGDFPRPAETLQHGPVWDAEVVKAWLDARSGRGTVVISVINLKGGVAKTTMSVAISEVLAKDLRKHVLFIDLDPQTNATINLIGEDDHPGSATPDTR